MIGPQKRSCLRQGTRNLAFTMILYLVGGYIRKYSFLTIRKKRYYLLGYVISVALTWSSKFLIEKVTFWIFGKTYAGNYLVSYISPTVVLAAIFLILFFKNVQIKGIKLKVISLLSPMTFSVYLIHNHPLVEKCMNKKFSVYASYSWKLELVFVLLTAITINIFCYIIDYIRVLLFKNFCVRQKLDKLEAKIYKVYSSH